MKSQSDEAFLQEVRSLPGYQLSEEQSQNIRRGLMEKSKSATPRRGTGRRRAFATTLSAAAAVAVVGIGVVQYPAILHHSGKPNTGQQVGLGPRLSTGAESETGSTFDYSQYISSFKPLLPSDTEGAKVSEVRMNINHVKGNSMMQGGEAFCATYKTADGKAFAVQQLQLDNNKPMLPQVSAPVNEVKVGNETLYELNFDDPQSGKNSIVAYVRGNVQYEAMSQGGFTTRTLEKILASLSVPCTLQPDFQYLASPIQSDAQRVVDFQPVIPTHMLPGFHLSFFVASTDSTSGQKVEEFDIEYESPNNGYLVFESLGKPDWALKQFATANKVSIDNQDVYLVQEKGAPDSASPDLVWLNPRTNVLFKVPTDSSRIDEFKQVMQSIIQQSLNE